MEKLEHIKEVLISKNIDPIRLSVENSGLKGIYIVHADLRGYDTVTDGWFVDEEGNNVFGQEWECVMQFADGVAAVCREGTWGFIHENGEKASDFIFKRVKLAEGHYISETYSETESFEKLLGL